MRQNELMKSLLFATPPFLRCIHLKVRKVRKSSDKKRDYKKLEQVFVDSQMGIHDLKESIP